MQKHDEKTGMPQRVVCNMCQNEIKYENGVAKQGFFSADVTFGFFSRKDGIRHRFDLCEDCYDRFVKAFQIPVEETEMTELV